MGNITHTEYGLSCASCEPVNVLSYVAPALEKYEREILLKQWSRPDLSARDRSIITVAAMIAKNQSSELSLYIKFALDNGVKPAELSEIITHLAFYAGWPNAMGSASIAYDIFKERKISIEELPPASPELMPLDREAESLRAAHVMQQFWEVAPAVVQHTTDILFRELWLRPGLAPRDRSLVTVSALIACGQVAQIPYHLNRAMDNGLMQSQVAEALSHLAFYVGWPNIFTALPVVKEVFEKRPL
jgi:4-carboxymuconolactone decarboxylase